jgi:hypothetical protein
MRTIIRKNLGKFRSFIQEILILPVLPLLLY